MRGVEVGRVASIGTAKDGASVSRWRSIPTRSGTSRPTSRQRSRHHGLRREVRRPGVSEEPEHRAAGRRRGAAVEQCQHRGQHGLREPCRPARHDRPGEAERGADRGRRRRCAAKANGSARPPPTLNQVLTALNPRSDTIREDWRSFKDFSDTYGAAAQDILTVLDAASTTSTTIIEPRDRSWTLAAQRHRLLDRPGPTCSHQQGQPGHVGQHPRTHDESAAEVQPRVHLPAAGRQMVPGQRRLPAFGGNDGRTLHRDAALLLGQRPLQYPDNLPIVAAKGGPGGKPGCGSLPDAPKNFPVRQLITNTGWGTGMDIRPNPGIGHPVLRQLLPGDPRGAGAAQHPAVPARAGARARSRIPGRRPTARRCTGPAGLPLWPGLPAAPPPDPGPAQPAGTEPDRRTPP